MTSPGKQRRGKKKRKETTKEVEKEPEETPKVVPLDSDAEPDAEPLSDEESSNEDEREIVWTDDSVSQVDLRPFISSPFLKVPLHDGSIGDPLKLIELFVPKSIIGEILKETNLYHAQCVASGQINENGRPCNDLTEQELRSWIGIFVANGLRPLAQIRKAWSSEECYRQELIANAMSCNRYELIKKVASHQYRVYSE